jgi:hypothetical protein
MFLFKVLLGVIWYVVVGEGGVTISGGGEGGRMVGAVNSHVGHISITKLNMGFSISMHVSFICNLCVLRLCMWNCFHVHVFSGGLFLDMGYVHAFLYCDIRMMCVAQFWFNNSYCLHMLLKACSKHKLQDARTRTRRNKNHHKTVQERKHLS